jgi:NADH dehydrogenase/NADH:ubiquinone oxidoreductase subunit G
MVKDIHEYYVNHGFVTLDDILQAGTIHVIGSQAFWSHPIIENRIRKAYKSGCKVIVANSKVNRTVGFSTEFHRYNKNQAHIYLRGLVEMFSTKGKGEKSLIIVGDEILYSDVAEENLRNLIQICTEQRNRIKLLFLLPEGNRYGATLAGMNPAMLPGFITTEKRGLSTEEMLKKQKVISSLYLVGDIPYTRALKGLSFFVQQNMFFTPSSECAHVFLPLADWLEEDGHIVNLEGRLMELAPAVPKGDTFFSTNYIISKIACEIEGSDSFVSTVNDVSDRLESLIKNFRLERGEKGKEIKSQAEEAAFLPPKTKHGRLTRDIMKKRHFHYMGNDLTSFVPDLQKVLEE